MLQWGLAAAVLTMVNLMDAVTFAPLLFTGLGEEDGGLVVDVIFMFLFACSTAQIIFSWRSSIQRGVCATVMVENLLFYQAMAQQIFSLVNAPQAMPTVLTAFALTTLLTALAYQLAKWFGLDRRVEQVPRVLLVGAMGGIGLYFIRVMLQLVESSCRASWWHQWPLLLTVMGCVGVAGLLQRRVRSPFTLSLFTLALLVAFYCLAWLRGWSLAALREWGWLLPAPSDTGRQPWDFYRHFVHGQVAWGVVGGVWPLALASAAFALLHPCLNVPSYARLTGEPFILGQELQVHAEANLATAFIGMLPSYFVYTSSLLFYRAGGNARWAGIWLAILTMTVVLLGRPLIGLIPLPVILFLIFYLCADLVHDSLVASRRQCRRSEYGILWATALGMLALGLVGGLLLGAFLAALHSAWDRHQAMHRESTISLQPLSQHLRRRRPATVHADPLHTAKLIAGRESLYVLRVKGAIHHGNCRRLLNPLQSLPLGARGLILELTHCSSLDLNGVEGILACLRRQLSSDPLVIVACPGNLRRALQCHAPHVPTVTALGEAEGCLPLWEDFDCEQIKNLQLELLEEYKDRLVRREWEEGELLFALGDLLPCAWLLVEGQVQLGADGLSEGSWIGLRLHLTQQPSPMTCLAITPKVVALAIDGPVWREISQQSHYQALTSLIL